MKWNRSSVMVNTGALSIFLALMCQFAAAGYVENYKEAMQPFVEECMEYVGANEEDAEKVSTLELLTTQSQACLQYCAFYKGGFMNGTNFASEDDIVKVYNQVHRDDEVFLAQARETVQAFFAAVSELKTDDACLLANFLREFVHNELFDAFCLTCQLIIRGRIVTDGGETTFWDREFQTCIRGQKINVWGVNMQTEEKLRRRSCKETLILKKRFNDLKPMYPEC